MTQRDFLSTWAGKLAAIAAALSTGLTFVATDPTIAVMLTEYLPGPLRLIAILAIALAAYVLPLFAVKKDVKAAASASAE